VSPDEQHGFGVKYWEIIADNLSKAGWSLGYVSSRRYPGTCHQFSALPLPLR